MLKFGVKTLLKGAAVAGTILLASTPVLGWALLGAASGALAIWSFTKAFRQKRQKLTEVEMNAIENGPIKTLNNAKDKLQETFDTAFKKALASMETPMAALSAKQASEAMIEAQSLSKPDAERQRQYVYQLYLQAQDLTPENINAREAKATNVIRNCNDSAQNATSKQRNNKEIGEMAICFVQSFREVKLQNNVESQAPAV